MPLEIEDLPPGPDIENFDPSSGDRGDSLEAPKTPEDKQAEADQQAEKDAKEVLGDKADEKTEDEKVDEKPRDDKGRFTDKIPKARFDEAVGKERAAREAAEARLAALERQIAESQQRVDQGNQVSELETKADELTRQHAKLLIDGEDEKAADVMREIRKIDREIVKIEQTTASERQTAATLEKDRVDLAIAQLEADHPVLNPDSEEFDESLSAFVLSEQRRLMQVEGLSASKALLKAGETIIEKYLPKQTSDAAPEPEKKGLKAQDDRKKEAVERNLDASKRQPASMKDTGLDSDKKGATSTLPDITQMTREEFDALPESTKARMRGDFV